MGAAPAGARGPRGHAAPRGDDRRGPSRRARRDRPRARPARGARAGRRRAQSRASTNSLRAAAAEADGAPALHGELRWSYGYTWTLQGVHATRAPLKRRHAEAELLLERMAEPLAALAGALGARRPPAAARRYVARAGALAVPRLDRRLHLGRGRAAGGGPAGRRGAGGRRDRPREPRRADRQRSRPRARPSRATPRPRLVLWNPVARPRAGERGHRRPDLVSARRAGRPPGRAGAARRATAPARSPSPVPTGRSACSRWAGRPAHERLDAPRHYPDQDEVDVVRVAFRAPPLGRARLRGARAGRSEPGRRGARRARRGRAASTTGSSRSPSAATAPSRWPTAAPACCIPRCSASSPPATSATPTPTRRRRVTASAACAAPASVRVLARGPLVATLEVRSTLACASGQVAARLLLTLHADSPALRCTLELDNRATDHRLRLRVPTGVPGRAGGGRRAVRAGERRRLVADGARYPRETPVATAPAQRYVAVARGPRAGAAGAGVLRVRARARRRPARDAAPRRGPALPRRSPHPPRPRGLARADARGPVSRRGPPPARRRCRSTPPTSRRGARCPSCGRMCSSRRGRSGSARRRR